MRKELNPVARAIADALLCSGLRVEEFWSVMNNPSSYKASRRCISLSKGDIRKKACRIKERDVILNQRGCEAIETCLALKLKKKIDRHSMTPTLRLAARKAGIGDTGVSPKMFRKMYISWLVRVYPEKLMYIAVSAGHTLDVMREHYLGISFAPRDVDDMVSFFKGWG